MDDEKKIDETVETIQSKNLTVGQVDEVIRKYNKEDQAKRHERDANPSKRRLAKRKLSNAIKAKSRIRSQTLNEAQKPSSKVKGIKDTIQRRNGGQIEGLQCDQRVFIEHLMEMDCSYCGGPGGGIDRLDSNMNYKIGNIVPCCSICNMSKNVLSPEEFLRRCKKIQAFQESTSSPMEDHCHYCGIDEKEFGKSLGIDRIKPGLSYEETSNNVLCCAPCNYLKRDHDLEVFKRMVQLVASNNANLSKALEQVQDLQERLQKEHCQTLAPVQRKTFDGYEEGRYEGDSVVRVAKTNTTYHSQFSTCLHGIEWDYVSSMTAIQRGRKPCKVCRSQITTQEAQLLKIHQKTKRMHKALSSSSSSSSPSGSLSSPSGSLSPQSLQKLDIKEKGQVVQPFELFQDGPSFSFDELDPLVHVARSSHATKYHVIVPEGDYRRKPCLPKKGHEEFQAIKLSKALSFGHVFCGDCKRKGFVEYLDPREDASICSSSERKGLMIQFLGAKGQAQTDRRKQLRRGYDRNYRERKRNDEQFKKNNARRQREYYARKKLNSTPKSQKRKDDLARAQRKYYAKKMQERDPKQLGTTKTQIADRERKARLRQDPEYKEKQRLKAKKNREKQKQKAVELLRSLRGDEEKEADLVAMDESLKRYHFVDMSTCINPNKVAQFKLFSRTYALDNGISLCRFCRSNSMKLD